MLHRITSAFAREDYTVEIVWEDGSRSLVCFASLAGRGVCAPTSDRDYFVAQMTVTADGLALAWPDEVEFSSDSLWLRGRHAERSAE
jgi:Protein of unknown function (DUF2442)